MQNDVLLDKFGRILISEVRDEAIDKLQLIFAGRIKSEAALTLHNKLNAFSQDQKGVIRSLVISSIDDVIHNFLWMLEQHEEDIDLSCGVGNESGKENVRQLSDGLPGEMYSEDGWIARFSKYKENY